MSSHLGPKVFDLLTNRMGTKTPENKQAVNHLSRCCLDRAGQWDRVIFVCLRIPISQDAKRIGRMRELTTRVMLGAAGCTLTNSVVNAPRYSSLFTSWSDVGPLLASKCLRNSARNFFCISRWRASSMKAH